MDFVYILAIAFVTATGEPGAAFDKNVHATEESCKSRAEHLIKSAPAQRFQEIQTQCFKMRAPKLPVESGPNVGDNT